MNTFLVTLQNGYRVKISAACPVGAREWVEKTYSKSKEVRAFVPGEFFDAHLDD